MAVKNATPEQIIGMVYTDHEGFYRRIVEIGVSVFLFGKMTEHDMRHQKDFIDTRLQAGWIIYQMFPQQSGEHTSLIIILARGEKHGD